MVPHLVTALTGPINELEQRMLDAMPTVERWFRLEWMEHTPVFYCAAHIRNAGYKLAPVTTDLHPNAWHHLSPDMLPLAVQAAMAAIEKICPEAKNLLLVPQSGERNADVMANLLQLRRIFHLAGLNVRMGSIDAGVRQAVSLPVPGAEPVVLEPVHRTKGRVGLKHFDPCTILLNNTLASGIPGILEDLSTQYLLPPLHAGASVRLRSRHLHSYEEVGKRLAKLLGIDVWLINPLFASGGAVDFSTGQGLPELRQQVDAVLAKVRRKYKEYGIPDKPFVVVKGDLSNTALGVHPLRDAKGLDQLDWSHCGGAAPRGLHHVIVQEGLSTQERLNDAVAEPVVYMLDRYVVGGFYRLQGPGAGTVPLAFETSAGLPQPGAKAGASAPNRFYMYGVVARLAMLAAAYDLEASDPNAVSYD